MAKADNLVIHTHLGLGDHFICCGLVRKIISQNEHKNYYIACKRQNLESVKPLFNDIKNAYLIAVNHDHEVPTYIPENSEYIKVGFGACPGVRFDIAFYQQLGFTIQDKYDYFKINRNLDKERELIAKACPEGEYIFVQDVSSVGKFNLKVPENLKIVKPDPSLGHSAVDYLGVIEKAKQVHLLHSSFLTLTDLALDRDELYFHRVKAGSDDELNPNLQRKWVIIDY